MGRIQDTPVYHEAMGYAVAVDAFVETLPSWRGYLKDQLRRASLSIVLNLREGGADIMPKEKARFYRISKRSAAETATALDFTAQVVPAVRKEAAILSERAGPLITQLYRLSRSVQNRARTRGAKKLADATLGGPKGRSPERRKASPA